MFSTARQRLNFDTDALADYRDRIGTKLCGVAALLLLPFWTLHLVSGRWAMAAVNTVLITVLLLNTWSLRRGRGPTVPFWAMVCALIAGIAVSVLLQGVPGVLWSYPALFICYFVLPRRVALLLSLVLLLVVSVTSTITLGPALAARVFMTLVFALVMINVVLNVIGQLQQALVAQAITDPLTGAYNRRHFQTQLAQLAVPLDPARPTDTLVAVDVDHFKDVNDRLGHEAGDAVLRNLVAAVAARKRHGDLLFRTGGEEFMLLLPRITADAALIFAEALRLRLAEIELLPGAPITVSIGVSGRRPGQSLQAWEKSADDALYAAKRAGRNCVVVASGQQVPKPMPCASNQRL